VAPKRMFLVDGSNHAFRVQFALPPQHASDGFPTRVLYGFTLLFQKMMRTYRPDYVAVSFDHGKSFRHQLFGEYKGHRREMPEDMRRQWQYMPGLVEAFGYSCVMAEGFEADDVLGTLARKFASDDVHVFIVTSDKDFGQLVDERIFLVDDTKGQVLGAPEILEKTGVRPDQMIDALALSGDTSDNIPGVPGVGMKTAATLLEEWGTLERVLEAAGAGRIKGKRGEMLVQHAEDARLSKRLATIALDVPVPPDLASYAPTGVHEVPLREMFDRWEFMEVATKLLPARNMVDKARYHVVTDEAGLEATLARVRAARRVGIHVRTDGGRPETAEILGIGLATDAPDGGASFVDYVPLVPRHDLHLDFDRARAAVFALLADPNLAKVGFDLKEAMRVLRCGGADLAGIQGDLKLLDYVLVAHRRTHGLAEIAKRHLGHNVVVAPPAEPLMVKELADLGGEPAHLSLLLHDRLEARLDEATTGKVYRTLELPLLPVLADMEAAGIELDLAVMDGIFQDVAARVEAAEKQCHAILGRPFKVGSPKEVGEILFEELGLAKQKRTKTGYSTDASVLESLADEHPLPQAILDWRALQKLESTYLRTLPGFAAKDGRIHTTYNQAVAATGRLSSTDPNLQNIPIRTYEGRRIRDGFVAPAGSVLMSADYSQVELRVLAHCCRAPALVASFQNGEDIHRRTASEVWSVPMAEVTYAQRSAAKAINFGLLYGMSAFRLGRDLQIEREQAQNYMDDYFGRMPEVATWIEATKEKCRLQGFVETLFGRRRLIPEIYAKDFQERMAAEREAVNSVVQGTAADLIKIAMIRVHAALPTAGLRARLLLQVHDELLLEVPDAEIDAVQALVRREMMGAAALVVPLVVDVGHGHDWNAAKGE
jgi:DNA polymerase-1